LKLLFIPLLLVLAVSPAFGQLLSDRTGLVNRLDVEVNGQSFEVESVSNYDVSSHQFDKDEKRLTIFIDSGIEDNFGELVIPQEFLGGNFTFYLNDHSFNPVVKSSDRVSFVTLNFTGKGTNKLDIIATDIPSDLEKKSETDIDESASEGGGCLIATATYGTELAPEIQLLREIRDQKLMKTEYGKSFMDSFNKFYYSFSPTVADYEREHPFLKDSVKLFLTPMISSLSILNYVQMDNNVQVLGVGIGVIALNIGMYFAAPAILIVRLKR
jgi:hypothetical protein